MNYRTPISRDLLTVPTVTLAKVANWLVAKTPFECRYELADILSNGEPCFGCVYELAGRNTKYMLISDTEEDEQFTAIVLFGWDDVRRHHQRFGDGRAIVLEDESAIVEPPFCVQALALGQYVSLKAGRTY